LLSARQLRRRCYLRVSFAAVVAVKNFLQVTESLSSSSQQRQERKNRVNGARFFVLNLRSTIFEMNPLRNDFMSAKQDEL
jgi:hypothetical protein